MPEEKTIADQHREEVLMFINSMPPHTVAKALIAITIQMARRTISDPEILNQVISALKSKSFVDTLTDIVRDEKVEGAIAEMAELDVTDLSAEIAADRSEPLAGQGTAFDAPMYDGDNGAPSEYDEDGHPIIFDPDPY